MSAPAPLLQGPFSGDRFCVAKFISPNRWDIVAFRRPDDPSVTSLQRVVGLPGERVEIRDGDVWIDGQIATKLPELEGLKYLANPLNERDTTFGPVPLAADEYFVLGDFSLYSLDSRIFKQGAPGHPCYAVPRSHVVGVVAAIYWPPARWRVFR
jgi:signal peptidase I